MADLLFAYWELSTSVSILAAQACIPYQMGMRIPPLPHLQQAFVISFFLDHSHSDYDKYKSFNFNFPNWWCWTHLKVFISHFCFFVHQRNLFYYSRQRPSQKSVIVHNVDETTGDSFYIKDTGNITEEEVEGLQETKDCFACYKVPSSICDRDFNS